MSGIGGLMADGYSDEIVEMIQVLKEFKFGFVPWQNYQVILPGDIRLSKKIEERSSAMYLSKPAAVFDQEEPEIAYLFQNRSPGG